MGFPPGPLLPNPDHPLNVGRVSWWKVLPQNYGGGRLVDVMGQNHGSLVAMSNANNGFRGVAPPGGWGSLLFDGTAGFVNVPDAASQRPAAVTVMATVKHTMASGSIGRVLAKPQVASNAQAYSLNVCIVGTTADFRIQTSGSATVSLQGTSATNDGNWHLIGGGYDPALNAMRVWFDGKRENSTSSGVAIGYQNILPMQIGRFDALGQYFAGRLEEVAVWNRLLSDAEAAEVYALSRRGCPGVLYRPSRTTYFGPAAATAGGLLMRRRKMVVS